MRIELISKADFRELNRLWKGEGLSQMDRDDFNRVLEVNSNSCLKLTDDKGKICSSVLGVFDGLRGSIYRLVVRSEYQKRKLGTKLIREVEMRLRKRGVKKILLRVETKNLGVKEFYYKSGYKDMDYAHMLYKSF